MSINERVLQYCKAPLIVVVFEWYCSLFEYINNQIYFSIKLWLFSNGIATCLNLGSIHNYLNYIKVVDIKLVDIDRFEEYVYYSITNTTA